MKDQLESIIRFCEINKRLNICREYLQSYILLLLQKQGFFKQASFVGGTCLRFVYNLPRFSEDLDFSLKIDRSEFDFSMLMTDLKKELENSGYTLDITYRDQSNVYVAMLKFAGIMYEFGLSPNANQKLNVKLDIDTVPPDGTQSQISLVTRYFPLTISHFNLESILAGKINAMLTRNFIKGRDYYDIFWILSQYPGIVPNLVLLTNALAQFKVEEGITFHNWRQKLGKVIEDTDMRKVINDVDAFIENSVLLSSFNKQGFELLLG